MRISIDCGDKICLRFFGDNFCNANQCRRGSDLFCGNMACPDGDYRDTIQNCLFDLFICQVVAYLKHLLQLLLERAVFCQIKGQRGFGLKL